MSRLLALLVVGAFLALAPSAALATPAMVDGTVTQKFYGMDDDGEGAQMIAVDDTLYEVPLPVYLSLNVGDIVHFDGHDWVIIGH